MANWEKIRIGDFLFEREGRYKPDAQEIARLKRIDKIDFSGNFHIANKPSKTGMILIKPGDLVISGINVSKGALGVYQGQEDVTATIHYSSYTFDETRISVEYFKRFLKSPIFIQLLKEQVKGGIKTEIKPKHLLPLEIILPGKQEQLDILSRFQHIENEDADLKSELTHQQTLLKKLRQQILQEAIEGKLTADWRTQHPGAEPAGELLKRIAAEKAQLIKDKKIKKQKPLPAITNEEKPFDLPPGWEWCRMIDVSVINPRNAINDELEVGFTPMRLVSSEMLKHPKYEIRQWKSVKSGFTHFADGDVVVAKITPCFENSKSGVISGYPNATGAGTTELHVIRKVGDDILALYIYFILKTTKVIENGKKVMKGAVGQKRVPKEYIEQLFIPIPPTIEQQAIVTKVEKLLALCDQLETQIAQNQTCAQQLMQAVLKEAFTANS